MRWKSSWGLAAACGVATALVATEAAAQTACNTLPRPLYGTGGSAHRPLFGRLAARLAALPEPVTVIYTAPGACFGINSILNNTNITGQATYWRADGTEATCTLPITGQRVDFGAMGNSPTNCPGVTAVPPTIGDFQGPVTTWNVVVPLASSQRVISSEAFYYVYGFGREGRVMPWIDETQIIRRDANSAAQIFVALGSGLPVERFVGVDALTNNGTITRLAQSTTPEAAIGFCSGEVADNARQSVRTLAWQQAGQLCAYTPDSSPTRFDKLNVRNGLYWLWSTTHIIARLNSQREIEDPRLRTWVGYFTGATPPSTAVPVLDIEIQNGNIPSCAMQVARTGDLSPLMSFQPAQPCGCYFEQVATGSTTCTPCTSNAQCPTASPTCRYGFCEVQ